MTRPRSKTHLLTRAGKVACDSAHVNASSSDPALVDCGRCARTIQMADAEAKAALTRHRKERS